MAGIGFVAFFLAHRVLVLHHRDEDAEARGHAQVGALGAAGPVRAQLRLGELLALYTGFFIYMGATDLLPEAHEHPSWRRVGLTVTGFAAILLVSLAVRA